MGQFRKWKHGGVTYPLTELTTNELLRDADPALYYAIQLFSSVIETHVGPRLLAQAVLEGLNFPSAVEKTVHFEPSPFLLSDQLTFPLFCLYRSEEQWSESNIASDAEASTWEWAYVLPPLTPRQIEVLSPIFRSVAVVVSAFAQQSYDPDYEGGKTLRELSGIQKMMAGPVRYGNFEAVDKQDRWWRAVTGKLLVVERNDIVVEGLESFEGVDVTIDEAGGDDPVLERFVEMSTWEPPTISAVSPNAGTKAGGATVTVTGTGFRPTGLRPKVLFGGSYATGVVVTHPTSLVCVTPAYDAYPTATVDVRVIAPDGQEATLADAYTFTTP